MRHFVNLTLSRRGREPIQSLQEKTTSFSPDVNAAFAEVDPKDAQGQDEGDDYEELAGKDIDQVCASDCYMVLFLSEPVGRK